MNDEEKKGILTGVPFLDRMLRRDADPDESLRFPDMKEITKNNVLIKGEPGAGKSILSYQIALNLINGIQFKEYEEKDNSGESGDSEQKPVKKINKETHINLESRKMNIIPIYFTFEQSVHEVKYNMERIFKDRIASIIKADNKEGKPQSVLFPIIVGQKKTDIRKTPLISELIKTLSIIITYFKSEYNSGQRTNEYFQNVIKDKCPDIVIDNSLQISDFNNTELPFKFVFFFDSINVFFDEEDHRSVLHSLISISEKFKSINILLLEDYSASTKVDFLYLSKLLEFQSDVVVSLTNESTDYYNNFIEIMKNRHSATLNGKQKFKILSGNQSMQTVDQRVGIAIYYSIHVNLTDERKINRQETDISTGIGHIDGVLKTNEKDNKSIYKNSFILVSGGKGTHKFPVGFNLLTGIYSEEGLNDSVMILSFDDESTLLVDRVALSSDINVVFTGQSNEDRTKSSKVKVKKYEVSGTGKPQLIEVSFAPGYLSVEEYLYSVQQLIAEYTPKRVLIYNTSLFKMRFPWLYKEKMFFSALVGLFRHNDIVSILIDVVDEGSDKELSYSLRGMADYLLDIKSLQDYTSSNDLYGHISNKVINTRCIECSDYLKLKGKYISNLFPGLKDKISNISKDIKLEDLSYAVIDVTNVRNKKYKSNVIGLTVVSRDKDSKNKLILFDI